MIQSVLNNKAASAAAGLASGAATFWDIAPKIAGALASTAAFIWICIQAYYFLKEKRKGK